MDKVTRTNPLRNRFDTQLPNIALALIIFVAVLQTIVVARFAWYLLRYGDLTLTVGTEELNIYALAKQQVGLPLYQPITTEPYSFVPYNFAFYKIYGFALDLLGAHRESIVIEARWITFVFAMCSVALFCSCVRFMLADYLNLTRLEAFAILGAGLLVFLGFNFSSSWSWTLRPDLAAITFELTALLVFIRKCGRDGAVYAFLLSGSLFAVAWSFKQSDVWIFFATAVWLVWLALHRMISRAWPLRELLRIIAFCAPLALTIILSFIAFGTEYIYNIIKAQSINPMSISTFRTITLPSFIGNLFFFLFFPTMLAMGLWWKSDVKPQRSLRDMWIFIVLITGLVNVLEASREGSGKNQLLEFFAVASLLAIVSLVRLVRTEDRRRGIGGGIALLMLAPVALVSAVMLVAPNTFGVQIPATAQSLNADRQLLSWYEAQPGPRFSTYGPLSLPWFSNGDHYPQFIMLDLFFERAAELGLVSPDYFQRAIGPAKTVVLAVNTLGTDSRNAIATRLRASGYRDIPEDSIARSFDLLVLRRDDSSSTER